MRRESVSLERAHSIVPFLLAMARVRKARDKRADKRAKVRKAKGKRVDVAATDVAAWVAPMASLVGIAKEGFIGTERCTTIQLLPEYIYVHRANNNT